jgi:cGMP-dependent 3',5'-cyclic phosphodiesterase
VTCADLSDYTKDWKVTKDICGQLYEEFVTQGDLEMRFDKSLSIMQNSATIFLPSLQTDFLNQICLPMFK